MPRAWVLIRDKPHYRSESFCDGLRRAGYDPIMQTQLNGKQIKGSDELVICWNAYGRYGQARDQADRAGCRTFVAENGYFGKDKEGRQFYALAEHGHTGSGRWRVGPEARRDHLLQTQTGSCEFAPWREKGEHILVCAQRGIGEMKMRSPYRWEEDVQKIIRQTTDRPIRVRLHPGRHPAQRELAEDLKNAWACVVWSSNSTTSALRAGIPTFYAAPHIVHQGLRDGSKAGALPLSGANLDNPQFGDREGSFHVMSWAQWSVRELEKGVPWQFLLPKQDPPGFRWAGGYKA
jgi:hypothetical protein